MNLLSDAEYRQLTDHERSEYWRGLFYDMENRYQAAEQERIRLKTIVAEAMADLSRA